MKRNKQNIVTDITFMGLLLLMFISVLFIVETTTDGNILLNIVSISIVFLMGIVTYFTSLTTGIALSICIIFIFLSVNLYISVVKGGAVSSGVYYWSIMLPLFILMVGGFSKGTLKLQTENQKLSNILKEFITIDEETGLKNQRAFLNDAVAYMNISRRYEHGLVLSVISIKHQKEIEKIIGQAKMQTLINEISVDLGSCVRKEDLVYLLDRDEVLWAILLMTNEVEKIKIVSERIKSKVNEIEVKHVGQLPGINIHMCIGESCYEVGIETPMDLLQSAKNKMQYDV
ncbi:MAG: GGDEF domain-containing protein [Cellulosilyticaceae bacterium]